MAAARHVRIALFFHPKLNTTASSPSPGTRSLKRCALSQETELPGTHPIPTIGLLPIFPPAPTPTPPLHATQHFVQEALFIGFAMNKALSIGQQGGGFAGIECWQRGRPPRQREFFNVLGVSLEIWGDGRDRMSHDFHELGRCEHSQMLAPRRCCVHKLGWTADWLELVVTRWRAPGEPFADIYCASLVFLHRTFC